MRELKKDGKIKLIIDLAEKHNITAYEFGNNTSISILAARKILLKETKNPSHNTLDSMLQYIEKKLVNSEEKALNEPTETYNKDLLGKLEEIKELLIRRTDVMSEALKHTLLNTDEILDKQEDTTNSVNELSTLLRDRDRKLSKS